MHRLCLALILILIIVIPGYSQVLHVDGKVNFIALGDSYTFGESVALAARWPVQLVDSIRLRGIEAADAKIIAMDGWRTDNLKDAITAAKLKNEYNLVGLLIGVNNQYQGYSVEDYKPQFKELLNTAIELAQGDPARVFVISIPDYGYTPFGAYNQPVITAGINQFNAANKQIASDKSVPYFFITDISRQGLQEPDLITTDHLHPSGKQYSEWVYRIMSLSVFGKFPKDTTSVVTGLVAETTPIAVYPNPFNDQLTIDGISEESSGFRLMNMCGQPVIEETQSAIDSKIHIQTSALADGFYIYQVQTKKGGMQSGKVIKRNH